MLRVKMENGITLRETIGERTGVVINFNELRAAAKRCSDDKTNKICRAELAKIGVKFVDEI